MRASLNGQIVGSGDPVETMMAPRKTEADQDREAAGERLSDDEPAAAEGTEMGDWD